MNKRFTRSEILFLTAYILWLLFAVIRLTYLKDLFAFSVMNRYVEKIVMGLLLLKLIEDDRYGIKGILGICVVAALYYVSLQANATELVLPVGFIFSARNVDYRHFFKATLAVQLSVMAVSVTCSLMGVIPNEAWEEPERIRYSLGYTFCTYGSHISLFLTLVYMSLRKRLKFMEAALLLIWNLIWYQVTDTRTDLFLFVPAIVGCYVLGRLEIKMWTRWIYRLALMLAGPVIAFGAIAAQWYFDIDNALWLRFDHALNSRLRLGHDAITQYGFSLWGQYIKWVGRGGIKLHPDWVYNYVDCSFLKYLLHYGIVFFVLLLLGLVLVGRMVAESRNPALAVAFVAWLLYGAVDAELFALNFQPFMLLLGYSFAQWNFILPKAMSGKICQVTENRV